MRRHSWPLVLGIILISCKKQKDTLHTPPPQPPQQPVLLKDVVVNRLPSPYYHFEYNSAKKVSFVSFASDYYRYDVIYDSGRISEMRNNITVNNTVINSDQVLYSYGNSGKVEFIKYVN